MRALVVPIMASGILAACSSQPQQVDNSPTQPTAVFETVVSSSGIAGFLPFEATDRHFVRAKMRRDEHTMKGTGTFTGFLVSGLASDGDAITRLDRDVRWTIDNDKKEYTECPVHGCATPQHKGDKPEPMAGRSPEQKQSCVMRIASSKLAVTPTGQKRELNGFSTDQYQVSWVLRMQDDAKRTTTSKLNFDVWTTPVSAQMRQALDTEATYDRAYLASGPRAASVSRGKSAQDRAEVMPPEVVQMMTAHLRNLSVRDRDNLTGALRELGKIKGHPISTKIEWYLDGDACAPKKGADTARTPRQGTDSLLSGVAGLLGSSPAQDGSTKPLLDFTIEVKALGMQPVHDGFFSVPEGYSLVKRL